METYCKGKSCLDIKKGFLGFVIRCPFGARTLKKA